MNIWRSLWSACGSTPLWNDRVDLECRTIMKLEIMTDCYVPISTRGRFPSCLYTSNLHKSTTILWTNYLDGRRLRLPIAMCSPPGQPTAIADDRPPMPFTKAGDAPFGGQTSPAADCHVLAFMVIHGNRGRFSACFGRSLSVRGLPKGCLVTGV